MKVYLFTFSGTGNTYITADFIARELMALGACVSSHKIEKEAVDIMPDISDADSIVISYPIHAFNAPWPVISFIKKLPHTNGKKVYIFKTAGEPFCFNRASSAQMIRLLTKKGYKVTAEKHILMPYNIMFRYPDALAKQMYLKMQRDAKDFAKNIISGEGKRIKYSVFGRIISFVFRIQHPGAKLNGRLYKADKNKCVMCLKCVNACPTGNIYDKDGAIKFGSECAMCMRCVRVCPHGAINIGLLRGWTVREGHDFKKLACDDSIRADFIHHDTRGYFRLFRKFFGVG